MKDLKILLVGHVTESYGPMQALPKYLVKNVEEFSVIAHPFSYSGIPASLCEIFKDGKKVKELKGPKYKTIEPVHFIGDILLTLYFLIKIGKRWDLYIGSDCLNVFTGLFLRTIGVVKKVVFYEYDFTPDRLKNKTLNNIFHWFNGFAARNANVVWDNPPNLSEIRKGQGVDLKKIFRVPHAVDLGKVKIPPLGKVNRNTLVYVGHVTESKGLQLVVAAVKNLSRKFPKIKVAIVGSGPYEKTLKELVKKEKLEKNFEFFGYTHHDWTLSYLPSCGVALAPYVNEDRGTFRFAEPLKVKDYLGCGLPIIITRVPDIAGEIDEKKLGIAIEYEQHDLEKAITKLLTDDKLYQKFRKNVLSYAANITWDYTYNEAFRKTLQIVKIE
jgi:glycosyltransferase involved in cell wall biosynthesis